MELTGGNVAMVGEEPFARQPLSHTNYKIDIDSRATQIKYTTDGMAVYMYLDEPGVYWNDHARRVPEAVAGEAGYQIEELARYRKMNEARRKVLGDLEADFAVTIKPKTIADEGDYQVIQVGPGRFNIVFKDGSDMGFVLNANGPVSKELAMKRFRALVGTEEAAEAATSQPVDADVAKGASKKV